MFNCHVHIFNIKCVPNRFFGLPLARALGYPHISRGVAMVLSKLIFFSKNDPLDKLSSMLTIGAERRQKDIFTLLVDKYAGYPPTRFAALTLDMEFMGAGDSVNNYISQLDEVARAKAEFPNELIAFMSVDPRRPQVDVLARQYIPHQGFSGIKLYPALGFFPFDPALRPIYELAAELELPIVSHCDIGGIFYRGTYTTRQLKPSTMNGTTLDYTADQKKKNKHFKDHFTNPENFREVLMTKKQVKDAVTGEEKTEYPFKNLKICLAHFGGSEMILGKKCSITPNNWYESIKKMMKDFPNVYADISYTLHNKKVWKTLVTDLQDPVIRDRVLFGTDFYMTVRENTEEKLIDNFKNKSGISASDFDQISVVNPRRFLSTTFYQP